MTESRLFHSNIYSIDILFGLTNFNSRVSTAAGCGARTGEEEEEEEEEKYFLHFRSSGSILNSNPVVIDPSIDRLTDSLTLEINKGTTQQGPSGEQSTTIN